MADNVSDTVAELAAAVRSGDRSVLPRAITLVESTRADHRQQAQELLLALLPDAGGARRVGITGVPGVGKSTTIEALGMHLIEQGHRVAVLAVDPSSTRTGGSILGDKTRMQRLGTHERAYIRPSPTSGTLGGVAKATRETVVLLEAAGFDVILIETVGVGQSEVTVAGMVDTFVFLTLARTGDQLRNTLATTGFDDERHRGHRAVGILGHRGAASADADRRRRVRCPATGAAGGLDPPVGARRRARTRAVGPGGA